MLQLVLMLFDNFDNSPYLNVVIEILLPNCRSSKIYIVFGVCWYISNKIWNVEREGKMLSWFWNNVFLQQFTYFELWIRDKKTSVLKPLMINYIGCVCILCYFHIVTYTGFLTINTFLFEKIITFPITHVK